MSCPGAGTRRLEGREEEKWSLSHPLKHICALPHRERKLALIQRLSAIRVLQLVVRTSVTCTPTGIAPMSMAPAVSGKHSPKQNHLLAALSNVDYERLLPDLELVPLPLGWAVYEAGGHLGYLYFPTTSIVSLLYVMEDGSSAEIAVTGNDGLVGIALFMGGESTPSRAVVQSAGYGYRLKASVLQREFKRGGQLQYLALRYTQALITQMAQTAVCNRHHSVEQQLCR